jgi:hypothetical protein
MATTIPKPRLGDTVFFLSHFAEGSAIYGTQSYRTVPAIVVGLNSDDTVDLQILERSVAGVTFTSRVSYDGNGSKPGTWRAR